MSFFIPFPALQPFSELNRIKIPHSYRYVMWNLHQAQRKTESIHDRPSFVLMNGRYEHFHLPWFEFLDSYPWIWWHPSWFLLTPFFSGQLLILCGLRLNSKNNKFDYKSIQRKLIWNYHHIFLWTILLLLYARWKKEVLLSLHDCLSTKSTIF